MILFDTHVVDITNLLLYKVFFSVQNPKAFRQRLFFIVQVPLHAPPSPVPEPVRFDTPCCGLIGRPARPSSPTLPPRIPDAKTKFASGTGAPATSPTSPDDRPHPQLTLFGHLGTLWVHPEPPVSAPGTPSSKRQIEAAAMPVGRAAAPGAPCMCHPRLDAIESAR